MHLRNFRQSKSAISKVCDGDPFTVVTYNLLADGYAMANGTCGHSESIAWNARAPALVKELQTYDADIMSLQEVEFPFLETTLGPHFRSKGYDWMYYGRKTMLPDHGILDEGACLMFRKSRFYCEASETVRFGNLAYHLTSQGSKQVLKSPKSLEILRERDDGAVLALLRDRQAEDKLLLVAATHLFWDPQYANVKAAQASLLRWSALNFVKTFFWQKNEPKMLIQNVGMVLAGDFNSLPDSEAYRSLVDENFRLPDDENTTSFFQSSSVSAWGKEPPATNHTHEGFSGCLDYIFYTPHLLDVIKALEMPYNWCREDTERVSIPFHQFPPIPDATWPSDHLAVGAVFAWSDTSSGVKMFLT